MTEHEALKIQNRMKDSGLLAEDEGTRVHQTESGAYVVRIWGVDEDHVTLRAVVSTPEGWTRLATVRHHQRHNG